MPATYKYDEPLSNGFTTPATDGPVSTTYPLIGAQTPDVYPRAHGRTLYQRKATYTPRLTASTSYSAGFTYPDDPSNAAWTKTNATGTAAQVANPADGAITGAKLVETAATGAHSLSRAFTFTAEGHVLTAFARYLDRDWVRFLANDGTEDFEGWFNLSTGATKPFADIINATTLNGGFETAGGGGADVFGSWAELGAAGTSTITDETVVVNNGSHACKLTIDASGNFRGVRTLALEPGRSYRLSLWARKSGVGSLVVYTNGLGTITDLTLSTVYSRYAVDFIAGDDGDLQLYCETPSGVVYIDDVTVTPIGQAPILSSSVRNGGFETAGSGGTDVFQNWAEGINGTSTITRDTSDKVAGAASCRFDVDAIGSIVYVTQSVLRVGRQYRLQFYAKGSSSGAMYWAGASAFRYPLLTGSWQLFSYDFTATSADFSFVRAAGSVTFWIDGVTLTPLDLPTLIATACPYPGDDWWRLTMVMPWVRAATGSVTLALSTDGTTLSYAGDTAKGAYLWRLNCRPGDESDIGPAVPSLGTVRSISAPDLDEDDPFAYLAAESSPAPTGIGDLVRFDRTFARIPGQQVTRDYQSFARPNCSGLKSGSTYAASLDGGNSFHLWTSLKSVTGSTTSQGSSNSNSLPSGNVTVTDTLANSVTFAANASQATILAALAPLKGSDPNGLSNFSVYTNGTDLTITWFRWIGGPNIASVVPPTGATVAMVGNMAQIKAFGTTITPDTKLILCPSHGATVGMACAVWNGDVLVATGSVSGVTDSNYLALVLSDLSSPDFNITGLSFSSAATVRYAVGERPVRIKITRDFFLPGVTMLADGTIMTDLDSIPDVTTYTAPQSWLDRIVAGATYVNIKANEVGQYLGPIAYRDTVSVRLADALESLSLT